MKLDLQTGILEGTPQEIKEFMNDNQNTTCSQRQRKYSGNIILASSSASPKKRGRPKGCKDKVKRKSGTGMYDHKPKDFEFGATSVRYK